MKWVEKFLNRYNTVALILAFLMVVLSFRLAILTIAEGDYYRELSDNKRVKEVYTTAPRGEIRDRYGRLLAGNIPSFTVQILKDELNTMDTKTKNDGILKLIRLLEEDGVSYVDEYPLDLNVFKYNSEDAYISKEQTPVNRVVDIIIENNLLPQILRQFYIHDEYPEHFQFIAVNRALNALRNKSIAMPIDVDLLDGNLQIEFNESENISSWKLDYEIPENYSPVDSIVKLINNDRTIIRKIIDHPISRMLVYNLIAQKGLNENLILEDFSLSYIDDYQDQKRILMKSYPEITMDTSAKDDFINIFIKTSLSNFLDQVFLSEDKDNTVIPGQLLIEFLKAQGQVVNINVEVVEDSNSVIYKYTGGSDIGARSPKDILIEQSKESGVLEEFITSESIRSYAQSQLLKDGVNPRISIAGNFQYVALNNLDNWYSSNQLDKNLEIDEAFEAIRNRYEIDPNISKYEVRSMLIIYNQLSKQGHLAYQPFNIAYGIKESTVARVEEGLVEMPGVNISIEPVRYYPEGSTAAHILGYLGKISQPNEIDKYIKENNYSPSAIIGKTGIEESYEDLLAGKSGVKRVEVDVIGNTTNIIEEIEPVAGDNIYLSIDLKTQQVAEEALKEALEKIQVGGTYESKWGDYKFGTNRSKGKPYENATSGSIVAIDVKSGQLIALANNPSYDPNLFSTGISDTDWESLFPEDENNPLAPRPLYNIATQTAVQPGSTFKMVTALAALEKGLDPEYKIRDMGYVQIGTKKFNCLIFTMTGGTHGYENVYEALRDSCNYYFYTLALGYNQRANQDLGMRVEIEDIVDLSKKLGLNDKTGIEINIPAEVSGGVPDPQRKIISTKYSLKQYLNRNIRNYVKDGVKLKDEEVEETIEEIIGWIEYEDLLTRNEVIQRLDELNIDPEKRLAGERESLADKIKYTYLNQANWNITDTLNVTIGQGDNSYTPIQMANFIATLSNGGYKHKLSLIESIKNYDNTITTFKHEINPERIALNDYENLEHVKKGMEMVSTDGTSKRIFANFPIAVASKTGTAERSGVNPSTGEKFDEFAWFVAYAPIDDPEIAVAGVIFQGGSGGYAGPMVRDVIAQYLGLNNTETENNLPYENVLTNE
ncbi:penicillin-binding protein [Tissierella creatinini]|nr:penicillin-binding protein [Tissierella creatinini]TJX63614.1 penicillin-binding protein [Soehngenia saccharolytica]